MKNKEIYKPIDYEPKTSYIKVESLQEFYQLLENNNFESVLYVCMNGDDRSPAVAKKHNNLEQLKYIKATYIPGGIHALETVILPKDRTEKYSYENRRIRKKVLNLCQTNTLWVFVAEEYELNSTNFLAYVAYLKEKNNQATIVVYPYSNLCNDYGLPERKWCRGGTAF